MLESVVSQVIAGLIVAGVISFVKHLCNKYKALGEYPRLIVLFNLDIIAGIACLVFGLRFAVNELIAVLFFACAAAAFITISAMFGTVVRALAGFAKIIDTVADDRADDSADDHDG